MPGPKDVIAWRRAMDLAVACYSLTRHLRSVRHAALASQLFRASISIPANIAEGHGRGTDREFARFLDIAMGSTREVETLVMLSERLGLAKSASASELLKRTDEVGAVIHGLRRSRRASAADVRA